MVALFGKLQEYEMELDQFEICELAHEKLKNHEGRKVKVGSLTLKSKFDSDQEEST